MRVGHSWIWRRAPHFLECYLQECHQVPVVRNEADHFVLKEEKRNHSETHPKFSPLQDHLSVNLPYPYPTWGKDRTHTPVLCKVHVSNQRWGWEELCSWRKSCEVYGLETRLKILKCNSEMTEHHSFATTATTRARLQNKNSGLQPKSCILSEKEHWPQFLLSSTMYSAFKKKLQGMTRGKKKKRKPKNPPSEEIEQPPEPEPERTQML